jgi:hypothetical protein
MDDLARAARRQIREIKKQYDPENVLRLNQNIKPD